MIGWLPGLGTLRKDHYIVEYTRPCKTSLQAFHLDFEADEEVNVRSAVLLSDRDVLELGTIVDQMRSWQQESGDDLTAAITSPGGPADLIRRYERRRLLLDGIALIARRRAQLARAISVLPYPGRSTSSPATTIPPTDAPPGIPSGGRDDGSEEREHDRSDAGLCSSCPYRLETVEADETLDETCETLASCLERNELGLGAVFDDDPRPNRAHVFWRASRRQLTSRSATRSYEKRVRLVLADDAPSLLGDVLEVLVAILIAVAIIAWFLVPDFMTTTGADGGHRLFGVVPLPGWFPAPGQRLSQFSRDAVVAILLLAPGLLLSRLEMPRGNRLLARLRTHSKRLAYGGALIAALFAIVLATSDSDSDGADQLRLVSRIVAGGLLALLATGVFGHLRTRTRRLSGHRPMGVAPVWADQWLPSPGFRDGLHLLLDGRLPGPSTRPRLWEPAERLAQWFKRGRHWVLQRLELDPSRPDAAFFAENSSGTPPHLNLTDGRIEEKTSELIVAAADRLLSDDRAAAIDVLHEHEVPIDLRSSAILRLGEMVSVGRSAVESVRRSGEDLPTLGRKFIVSTGKFAGQVVITSQFRTPFGSNGSGDDGDDTGRSPSVTVTNESVDETFYFGGRVRLEFFVLARAWRLPEPAPSRELARRLYEIAAALVHTDAAFVFCDWPAAWPAGVVSSEADNGVEALDVSRLERHGLRFAIDLPRSSKVSGVDELERIITHVRDAACVWMLDGRDTRSSWTRLLDNREPEQRRRKPSSADLGPDRQRVLPISLVGALRIGTTSLLLEALLSHGCEVVGFSERWIDRTLVFNITLAVDTADALPVAQQFHYREELASEHRNVLAGFVATDRSSGNELALTDLLGYVGGVFVSPPIDTPFHNDPEGLRFGRFESFKAVLGAFSDERPLLDRAVIWCRWDADVRSESVVKNAVRELTSVFREAAQRVAGVGSRGQDALDVAIDYLELAPDGPGRMSGYAQVSIGVGGSSPVLGHLTEICLQAEAALGHQLADRSSIPTEVHVSWDRPLRPPKFVAVRS